MTIDEDGDCVLCVHGICSAHQVWVRAIDDDNNGNRVDGEMVVVNRWKSFSGEPNYAGIMSWPLVSDEGHAIEVAVRDDCDIEGYASIELTPYGVFHLCERLAKLARKIDEAAYERFVERLKTCDP